MPGNPNTNRQAYGASVSLSYILDKQSIPIAPERIKYIIIDTNYETEIMPKLYMSISVDTSLYNYITNYKDEGKFKLRIQRKNVFSRTSLSTMLINDTFAYIPSTTNADYLRDISEGGSSDDSYKNILIGLISTTITDNLRKSFNYIYNNIDQQTLVSLATEGLKIVTKPLTYNKKYDSILVPPVTTRNEFLKYIFDTDNFYDTNMLFFMDFNRSYLLARDGSSITNSDDPIDDVYIDIKSLSNDSSYYDGIDIIQNSYYLYVNPMNSNVIIPDGMNKIVNRLVVVDDDEELQMLDVSLNNNFDNTIKEMFIRAENGSVFKNDLESENVIVEISKKQTDGYSFTPNKSYIVNNFGNYKKHNGRYLIASKKEYFRVTASGDFTSTCYLALRKIGTTSAKYSTSSKQQNLAVKSSTKVTSSADKFNTTTIVSASGNR